MYKGYYYWNSRILNLSIEKRDCNSTLALPLEKFYCSLTAFTWFMCVGGLAFNLEYDNVVILMYQMPVVHTSNFIKPWPTGG